MAVLDQWGLPRNPTSSKVIPDSKSHLFAPPPLSLFRIALSRKQQRFLHLPLASDPTTTHPCNNYVLLSHAQTKTDRSKRRRRRRLRRPSSQRWWGQRGFVICSESKTKDWLVPHKTGSIQFLCVHISRIIIGSVSLHLTWSNRQR